MYSSATIKSCVDDEFLKKESDSGYLSTWFVRSKTDT